jgi:hypothetical protein
MSFFFSWIGSLQLFLLSFTGLMTGKAYDAGYLLVHTTDFIHTLIDHRNFSYHMLISGSLLFVFCLFMLSLAQPEQYYQVGIHLRENGIHSNPPFQGFPCPRYRPRPCHRNMLCTKSSYCLSILLSPTCSGDGNIGFSTLFASERFASNLLLGRCIWWSCSPNHAQQTFQWACRV